MINAEGMRGGEVRCDKCGFSVLASSSFRAGGPHDMPGNRCRGTFRTAAELDAMVRERETVEAQSRANPPAQSA
jgi:hypothetical protein